MSTEIISDRLKLLYLEDQYHDINACKHDVKEWNKKKEMKLEVIFCCTVSEACKRIDHSFDGVIIDLKIGSAATEGTKLFKDITSGLFWIPVVLYTGTPANADDVTKVFTKSVHMYKDVFDFFYKANDTGAKRVKKTCVSMRRVMYVVYRDFIQLLFTDEHFRKHWLSFGGKDRSKAENALIRSTFSHLLYYCERDSENESNSNNEEFFPDEFYISAPKNSNFPANMNTGSIVFEKEDRTKKFVVLNPSCDLVARLKNEVCVVKAESYFLIEIENPESIVNRELQGIKNIEKRKKKMKVLLRNEYTLYYHWLPSSFGFSGGFMNFRKVHCTSTTANIFLSLYSKPERHIAPAFLKVVVERFSKYYARHGQPEIDHQEFINKYLNS